MEKLSKIGDVEFSATTSEEVSYENEVTDRPVEDLGYISDHVKQRPVTFSITGVVVGTDAYAKLKILLSYRDSKHIYKYFGRNIMSNVLIQSLTTTHNKEVRNGFTFTMQCKIIKIAKSKIVKLQGTDPVKKQQIQNKVSQGASPKKLAPVKMQTSKVKSKGKVINMIKATDTQKVFEYLRVKLYHDIKKYIRKTGYKGVISDSSKLAKNIKTSSSKKGKY
ncbi:MAG: phage baseplate protein [Peptoanaerobacter stomatis]|uniref:phage baseplate protein n=1 Tax=Peptoanaerobacter stomatis TaxID=796937 RepID=UPI003FA17D32